MRVVLILATALFCLASVANSTIDPILSKASLSNKLKGGKRRPSAAGAALIKTGRSTKSTGSSSSVDVLHQRGGGRTFSPSNKPPPSIYWAVLHNWLYFLSLGFNLINIQFLVREIVDGETSAPSAKAIALSGKVESVDKFLTFCGVGFLSALSDKYGRRPLMAWSAVGFMITNLIQANTKSSIGLLYLADFVDGCSSCMLPLCQAYITDVSHPANLAGNLGIFQGLSGTLETADSGSTDWFFILSRIFNSRWCLYFCFSHRWNLGGKIWSESSIKNCCWIAIPQCHDYLVFDAGIQ